MVKKLCLFVALISVVVLSACGLSATEADHEEHEASETDEANKTTENNAENEVNEKTPPEHNIESAEEEEASEENEEESSLEAEEVMDNLFKENDDESNDANELPEESDHTYTIPTTSIESPFGEDGDIRYEHTEQEIVQEYMDESGRIYFALDEYPVRAISHDGQIESITNYGDTYIDILEARAYHLPTEEEIEAAYLFFISHPPDQLEGKDPSEYRSWEEASNLERGIIQLIWLVAPALNELDDLMAQDIYSGKEFDQLLGEFKDLGSPMVTIPAAQSILDMQLFDNMLHMQSLWGQLGKFEQPDENQEEFRELYDLVRQEATNVVGRVNYTLGQETHLSIEE